MSADILVIDDESDIRGLIQGILEDEGYKTREAATDQKAYRLIEEKVPDLVILDIWLQGSRDDGMKILESIKATNPLLPVLMISGHGTIETAVSAIKQGAYDFIEKPFKSDRLLLMIERALETARLRRENNSLKTKTQGESDMIGASPAMASLLSTLSRVAQTNSRVMITGEPGTGKDLAARFIHRHSQRAGNAFMTLNCATMRPERLEIELFGSEHGVNGEQATTGVLEQANGGTLLLDEVADMPLETQGKILRVLQEQKFQRVGGQTEIEVDVRIIASSNRHLLKAIEQGDFRQDLYYRLNVVPVEVPPLRDRVQDIAAIASYFCELFTRQMGRATCRFDEGALAVMQGYDWPGNVRQLRNVVEWCVIMGSGEEQGVITATQLPPDLAGVQHKHGVVDAAGRHEELVSLPLREAREAFEKDYILAQVKRFGGNISRTAEFVGMERSALHRKMKQLGVPAFGKSEDAAQADTEGGDGDLIAEARRERA